MKLGKLERVEVRDIWKHEAHDFTPWLLEHADYLEDALGIGIDLENAEHPVGGFSLDLIGRDLTNDAVLIVENQLEKTDHAHLGQILTYAAGTDAASIVWIATVFREEHRQAIDWLNEQTRENIRFFGVELQVTKIGTSLPAPLFKLVAQPNSWQKQVRSTAQTTKTGAKASFYLQFWTRYLERMNKEHPEWPQSRNPTSSSWMNFTSPIKGIQLNPSFAQGARLRHEIYIDTRDADRNTEIFDYLSQQKDAIEAEYGGPLDWEELPTKKACRIANYRENADVVNVGQHEEHITWLLEEGVRLRRVLEIVKMPN